MEALKKKKIKAITKELNYAKKLQGKIKPEIGRRSTENDIINANIKAELKNFDLKHEIERISKILEEYVNMSIDDFYGELDYDAKYYLAGRYTISSKALSKLSTNAQSRLTELMVDDVKFIGDDEDDEIIDIRKSIDSNFYLNN